LKYSKTVTYNEKESFLSAGTVVGALLTAIVCLAIYTVNTDIHPLPTIQAGGSITVAMSAIVAFQVFRVNSYKIVSDERKRPSIYCMQMTNSTEAKFYLNECGLRRLEGDKNGVPCEAICR